MFGDYCEHLVLTQPRPRWFWSDPAPLPVLLYMPCAKCIYALKIPKLPKMWAIWHSFSLRNHFWFKSPDQPGNNEIIWIWQSSSNFKKIGILRLSILSNMLGDFHRYCREYLFRDPLDCIKFIYPSLNEKNIKKIKNLILIVFSCNWKLLNPAIC